MIHKYKAKRYCSEDISLIENYQEAISDQKRMWDVHHRAETDERLTKKELISQGRYFKRPASELVFLTKSAHKKLHFDSGTCENAREVCKKIGQKNQKAILQFTKNGQLVREWPSLSEAERQLGIPRSSICACLKYGFKHAGGFVWKYKD